MDGIIQGTVKAVAISVTGFVRSVLERKKLRVALYLPSPFHRKNRRKSSTEDVRSAGL
jgi:hypothetical protein